MPLTGEQVKLTILLGTTIILLFGISVIALFNMFSKKSQLNQKEKEILKANFEKDILQAQLEIQEHTFSSISQEIHDNVGQILSLAKIQVELYLMNLPGNAPATRINEVKENIANAIANLRDLAKGLSSDRIMYLSIDETVAFELDKIEKSGVCHTQLLRNGSEQEISGQKKLILFRIIQESLQNILKHAAATSIIITIGYEPEVLSVTIADNGKGFDSEAVMEKGDGLGFANIKKRAALAGGSAQISSRPGEGTVVHIRIPYEQAI
jgi:two-component system, NarL family, sensor kinase